MRLYEKLLLLQLQYGSNVCTDLFDRARTCTQLHDVGVRIDNSLYELDLLRSLQSKLDTLAVALQVKPNRCP